MDSRLTRRRFLRRGLATAGTLIAAPYVLPAWALGKNGATAPGNRICMGFVGLGGQGRMIANRSSRAWLVPHQILETKLMIQAGPHGRAGLLGEVRGVGELAIMRTLRGSGDGTSPGLNMRGLTEAKPVPSANRQLPAATVES